MGVKSIGRGEVLMEDLCTVCGSPVGVATAVYLVGDSVFEEGVCVECLSWCQEVFFSEAERLPSSDRGDGDSPLHTLLEEEESGVVLPGLA